MAAYSQANVKRQKITREPLHMVDSDYFPGIPKVEYKTNTHLLDDTLCYRYYNALERVHGKTMEEWIRPAISLSAFKYKGNDTHGKPTYHRTWDDLTNTVDNRKRCIKACFEFCAKLGVKYWSAYDHDLYPSSETIEQTLHQSEEILDFIVETQLQNQVKPLWIAPDLHSDAKYASGAFTANEANTFMAASQQTKRALEIAHRLTAESFLLWTGREGYNTLLNADVQRELKQCARFLKMTSNYKERLSYRGQLLIDGNSYRRNILKHNYFKDPSDVLCFLKHYNLDRYYKLSVRPGRQFTLTNFYNMTGGIELHEGDFDVRDATHLMKAIVDIGGIPPGGINLNIRPSRDSVDVQDLCVSYINIIDMLAKGLRIAAKMSSEQTFTKIMQQRYASFSSGYGTRLLNSDVNFEDCEEQLRKVQGQSTDHIPSSRNEHLQSLLQRYVDSI